MRGWNRDPFKMFSSRTLAAVIISCGLTGCSGQVYTVHNPVGKDAEGKDCILTGTNKCKLEGVLAYHPALFYEISFTTSVLKIKPAQAAQGNNPAQPAQKTSEAEMTYDNTDATKRCIPQREVKPAIRGDYARPYQLYYDPGFLEKYTFKSEFDQGVLKSLNTDSAPDRGETLKNISTVAAEAMKIASMAAAFVGGGGGGANEYHCTDEPVLTYVVRAEDVCPLNGKCQWDSYNSAGMKK